MAISVRRHPFNNDAWQFIPNPSAFCLKSYEVVLLGTAVAVNPCAEACITRSKSSNKDGWLLSRLEITNIFQFLLIFKAYSRDHIALLTAGLFAGSLSRFTAYRIAKRNVI